MRNPNRKVRFTVEQGVLVRYVDRPDGRGHVQRANIETLKEVCYFVEEHGEQGTTTREMWDALLEFPATQISVALDFLKDRALIDIRCRRSYPASTVLFEDAMVNFYALAERGGIG